MDGAPARMRRFCFDLWKVMRVTHQPVQLSKFLMLYEQIIRKPFIPGYYGMDSLEALLDHLPPDIVIVNKSGTEITLETPRAERTPEQILKTKQFTLDIVEFLGSNPEFSILFSRFIPAYHHYFGVQCRVSEYGFSRLIELLDEIRDVVKLEMSPNGGRMISLTVPYALKVLGAQLRKLIQKDLIFPFILLESLPIKYMREYGFLLAPEAFECSCLLDVVEKLSDYVQLRSSTLGLIIVTSNKDAKLELSMHIWSLLYKAPYHMTLVDFARKYQQKFNKCPVMSILKEMNDVVMITTTNMKTSVHLTHLYIVASKIYYVLYQCGGKILFSNLELHYKEVYNTKLKMRVSFAQFFQQFNWLFLLKGNHRKQKLSINTAIADFAIPLPEAFRHAYQTKNYKAKQTLIWPPEPIFPPVIGGCGVGAPKPDTPTLPAIPKAEPYVQNRPKKLTNCAPRFTELPYWKPYWGN